MNPLSRKIVAEVENHPGPGVVSVSDGPFHFSIDLSSAGPVGVAFNSLQFSSDHPTRQRSSAGLKQWGDRVAHRLNYLMEPLVVLEFDELGGELEIRSQTPSVRDSFRSYYEISLRREGALQLRRIGFDAEDRRRRPVPCRLTIEALERLSEDLIFLDS